MARILITGATDGIGLETAKTFVSEGHDVIVHGRSPDKLERILSELSKNAKGQVDGFISDLSDLENVEAFANSILEKYKSLDVLINNAGILKTPSPITDQGFDIRFVVNTFAPFLLTQKLLPILGLKSRVINLSSAAQSPVSIDAMKGALKLDDLEAYAQSKLAITMWSQKMAKDLGDSGPIIIAVNPGSLLASTMVKEGFGMEGKDIGIGVRILTKLSLSQEHESDSGKYFDNDLQRFSEPHPDALNSEKVQKVVQAIEDIIIVD
jgi:NAD(P)-dependent dehydrogenase (short-subunit alcohol dehydrogenase family)